MNLKINLTNINFTAGRPNGSKPIFIVYHYTANDGDSDEGNAKYFKSQYRGASAHYFVDEDSVTQVVKDSDTAWHCGDNQKYTNKGASMKGIVTNRNSIGIEMCSDIVNGSYVLTKQTQENAIELGKMLMQKYGIPVGNVYRHFDVTGKICPQPFVNEPLMWAAFKRKLIEKVEKEEEEMVRYSKLKDIPNDNKFRDVIGVLMTAKIVNGDGSDANGNGDVIDLSHDQVRSLNMEYRGGAFDRKLIAMGLPPVVKV